MLWNRSVRLVGAVSLWAFVVGLLVVTSGVAGATPANNSNTLGLVASYEFTGNAEDSSGNSNHGVVHGATPTTDRFGNANSAYSFDGVDDYIEITNQISGYSDFTTVAWFKAQPGTSTGSADIVLTGNGRLQFSFDTEQIRFDITGDRQGGAASNPSTRYEYVTTESLGTHAWRQVAVAVSADNTAAVYVDGVQVQTNPVNIDAGITGNALGSTIGSHWSTFDHNFSGDIDDVYIYNRALSASEVFTLANVPEPSTALLLGIGLAGLGMRRRG